MSRRIFAATHRFNQLGIAASAVVLLAAIPLLFVVFNALSLSVERWVGLWTGRLPGLLWNTLTLAVAVACGCFLFGVSCAWFIARREFAGRRVALWLLVLPLTIPTYVFAYIYSSLLGRDGWIGALWFRLFATDVPNLYNLWGVSFILSLAGFSYVFLLVRAALMQSSRRLDEAARIHGATPFQVFTRVHLPMMRPAIAAGLAVVVLHVLSDFGAVSMLRYQTFTLSIYMQMSGRFDYQAAAGLSLLLVMLSITFLVVERFFRSRQRYYSSGRSQGDTPRRATQMEQAAIWLWLGFVVFFSFILPLAWMVAWSWDAWISDHIGPAFWRYTINSGLVSFTAATIAVVLAFPVGLFHARMRSWFSQGLLHLSNVGFALPGPVVALGVTAFVLSQLPVLYGGFVVLVMAVVVRFLPLAVQSQEAAMQQLRPSIEQAGRILGAGPLENLWRVTLPMIRGGLLSAWVLVFIDVLKELPATLLLRPIGFDTLPVRIWIEASEEMLELAAPAALMLVVGTLPAIWVMMQGEESG